MALLAYGSEQVLALELALGGKPPKHGAKHVAAILNRQMRE